MNKSVEFGRNLSKTFKLLSQADQQGELETTTEKFIGILNRYHHDMISLAWQGKTTKAYKHQVDATLLSENNTDLLTYDNFLEKLFSLECVQTMLSLKDSRIDNHYKSLTAFSSELKASCKKRKNEGKAFRNYLVTAHAENDNDVAIKNISNHLISSTMNTLKSTLRLIENTQTKPNSEFYFKLGKYFFDQRHTTLSLESDIKTDKFQFHALNLAFVLLTLAHDHADQTDLMLVLCLTHIPQLKVTSTHLADVIKKLTPEQKSTILDILNKTVRFKPVGEVNNEATSNAIESNKVLYAQLKTLLGIESEKQSSPSRFNSSMFHEPASSHGETVADEAKKIEVVNLI